MYDGRSFWVFVKNGSISGFCLGLFLILLIHVTDPATVIDLSLVALLILFPLICGAGVGSLVFLVYSGAIGAWKLIQWFIASLILNISFLEIWSSFLIMVNSLYGQITIVTIPVLIMIWQYSLKESPKWIKKSVGNIIIYFLTSLGMALMQYLFPSLLLFRG